MWWFVTRSLITDLGHKRGLCLCLAVCKMRKENTVVLRGCELRGVLSSCVFQLARDTFSSLVGEKHFECFLKQGLQRDFNYWEHFMSSRFTHMQTHSHTLWLSAWFVFSSGTMHLFVLTLSDCENIVLMPLRITWLVFYSRRSLCSQNVRLCVRDIV